MDLARFFTSSFYMGLNVKLIFHNNFKDPQNVGKKLRKYFVGGRTTAYINILMV